MHRHHGVILLHGTTADTSQFLHVSTAAQQVTDMDAQSTDIGSSFAADPKDPHVTVFIVLNELGLINGSDTELLLDGGDQGWSLEAGALEGVKGLLELLDLIDALMELDDGDVLFTG